MLEWLRTAVSGICMGVAEIVPGISGGTVAFVFGIYRRLLDSVKTIDVRLLFSLRLKKFFWGIAWRFLLPLILGMSLSVFTLAKLFTSLLADEVYRCYLFAVFMGFVLAAALYCGRQAGRWSRHHVLLFIICASASYGLTGFIDGDVSPAFDVHLPKEKIVSNKKIEAINNYDHHRQMLRNVSVATLNAMIAKRIISPDTKVYSYAAERYGLAGDFADGQFSEGLNGWFIFCGAIGIGAMLLPGVSGSYLLMALGAYPAVIGALADFCEGLRRFSFNVDAFFVLFSVFIGICIGALISVRILSWLFDRYKGLTIAMLTGFMVGSLRCVWPFWSYHYNLLPLELDKGPQLQVVAPVVPGFTSTTFVVAFLLSLLGFGAIFALEFFTSKKKIYGD